MHFGLSEEQELLQETFRGFAQAEFPPQRLREVFDAGEGHDPGLWKGLAEMGLTGLVVPEAHGGAGLEILELALCCEVAGATGIPGALLEHSLACLAIDACGDPSQRERWLPGLATGDVIGTLALAEPDAECETADPWDPDGWQTRTSNGTVSGFKQYVPHLDHAGLVVVGLADGGLAVVEPSESDAASVRVEPQDGIDRTRPISKLRLQGAAAQPLPNATAESTRRILDAGLVGLAADAFGAATRLIQLSADYAKDRKQFGQPIAQFQAVKHQIARMGTEIEPTRALLWYAAHALDRGLEDAGRHAAMTKAHVTAKSVEVARDAVELHGGLGFTWECDVQLWFKRAMFDRSFLGTPEVHRERIATLAGW